MPMQSRHGVRLCALRSLAPRQHRNTRPLPVLIALLLLAACGGGGSDPVAVATVTVTPATASIATGGTSQLAAAALDANGATLPGRPLTWSTSNTGVATVSTGGLVTGVAPGSANITAASGGKTGTAVVTVLPPPVASVSITPAGPSLLEARTQQLEAVLKAADSSTLTGRVVTWSSATPSVATVSNAGLVTGVQLGTSVITATSEGKAATTTVTVIRNPCSVAVALPIVSGTPINGTLASTDCSFSDQTYADAYRFTLASATTVDVVLRSTAFDAYLFILNGTDLSTVAQDDDAGGGNDARLTGSLPAGTFYVIANSINPNGFGAYTLTLTSPFTAPVSGAGAFTLRAGVPGPLQKLGARDALVLRALTRQW